MVAPPRSKPDQFGEIHCPFSMSFTLDPDNPIDAASALRDIELRYGCRCPDRASCPLFATSDMQPYTHAFLHSLLRRWLAHAFGTAAAHLYTWHSYRSGLATALHAAGVDDGMVQLICRWMCAASLHTYRRMGVSEHERLIRLASGVDVNLIQSVNVPIVVNDQQFAAIANGNFDPAGATDALPDGSTPVADIDTDTLAPFRTAIAQQEKAIADCNATPPPARPAPAPKRRKRNADAPTVQPLYTMGDVLEHRPAVGDFLVVPREVWQTYPCNELESAGWLVRVLSASSITALVGFVNATTKRGIPYEDVRLPLHVLRRANKIHA